MASSVWIDLGDQGGPFSGQMLAPAADNTATPPYSFQGDTDTGYASSAANTLALVAGGTTRLSVSSTAVTSTVPILGPDGLVGTPTYAWATDPTAGFYHTGTGASGVLRLAINGALATTWDDNGSFALRRDGGQILFGASSDAILAREGADRLIFKRSTTAQRLDVANTYTSASNNELFSVDWQTTAGTALVGTRTAATGTTRPLKLVAQAANAGAFGSIQLDSTGLVTTSGAVTAGGTITTVAGGLTTIPLTLTNGTNLTTATANAIENDGTAFYKTMDTTNGRGVWDGWQMYRLDADSTGISGIADFFAATGSGIPLVANGFYELEYHCVFTQATAGTATWTIVTATTALAYLDAWYLGTNIAGGGAVGAPQIAGVNTTSSSSTALAVTGTEATGVTHMFDIHIMLKAGNGASNTRLRLTMGAGTATPKAGSYVKVRRLATATITGTFAT